MIADQNGEGQKDQVNFHYFLVRKFKLTKSCLIVNVKKTPPSHEIEEICKNALRTLVKIQNNFGLLGCYDSADEEKLVNFA